MYSVLIIDDEKKIRKGIQYMVDFKQYGFHVIGEAKDGCEGERMIVSLEPDLIFLDIRMPGLTGLELLAKIREKGIKSKVIILTGFGEFSYAKEAVALNVSGYLLKPLDEEELIKHLKKLKISLDQIYHHRFMVQKQEILEEEKKV